MNGFDDLTLKNPLISTILYIFEQLKFQAQLSEHEKSFKNLGPG